MRLLEQAGAQRFTQDSPILPEVWLAFAAQPKARVSLLLTPHEKSSAPELANQLRLQLGPKAAAARIAFNTAYVVADLLFEEVIRCALPLTRWWHEYVWKHQTPPTRAAELARLLPAATKSNDPDKSDLSYLANMTAVVLRGARGRDALFAAAGMAGRGMPHCLWSISRNRPAEHAIWRSTGAVKADAARRVFEICCPDICWGVVDCGIDARHPAFRKIDERTGKIFAAPFDGGTNNTRIVKTYDFSRLRGLFAQDANAEQDLYTALTSGRSFDWRTVLDRLEVTHDERYEPPAAPHGTHVAGILAGDWREKTTPDGTEFAPDHDLVGVCPDLPLYDLRVFGDGGGDEFSIIAALQFVRWLNANKDQPVLQGVNLSLSLIHDVRNFACGRTPVCEECERLSGNGIVVVAAAGNRGYRGVGDSFDDDYRGRTITDPGNADSVITVGATHRYRPHSYGVSYFSSRGPTGDGRRKPDLVAPGEKILSCLPDASWGTMDGTSMSAPHVSGAAALLMARHTEFAGQPRRVKEILMQTATSLGREAFDQGAGVVDILRALQSV